MISRSVNADILETPANHIAFAINTEGWIDAGFAGLISNSYWPELSNCGQNELGTVLSKRVGDKTFHALVCHSINDGWCEDQRELIKECYNKSYIIF